MNHGQRRIFSYGIGILLGSACLIATATAAPTPAATKKAPAKPAANTPKTSVTGNPLKRRSNFTVNSNTAGNVDIQCVFINSGPAAAALNVWDSPKSTKPSDTIMLKPASTAKPDQVTKEYRLNMQPEWWCRIYAPHGQKDKWGNCAYFSVSDATILENNPFADWPEVIHSKHTSFTCKVVKPTSNVSFFHVTPRK